MTISTDVSFVNTTDAFTDPDTTAVASQGSQDDGEYERADIGRKGGVKQQRIH